MESNIEGLRNKIINKTIVKGRSSLSSREAPKVTFIVGRNATVSHLSVSSSHQGDMCEQQENLSLVQQDIALTVSEVGRTIQIPSPRLAISISIGVGITGRGHTRLAAKLLIF